MVSIIIPTYNEAASIGELLRYLRTATVGAPAPEVLVLDGGSTDATVPRSPRKGRAAQLNHGAAQARGEVLY
ncbi:MAG: glycosyltransferase, partial [Hymenobacter sp.]